MTKNKLLLFSSALLGAQLVFAQNEEDALRYSTLSSGTTARSLAIGGAAGSLGADFSAASVNPAGLGLYRQSEFTVTPSLNFNMAKGSYLNASTNDSKTAVTINNLGMVFHFGPKGGDYDRAQWKGFTLGIGANRLADFNKNVAYSGINGSSSFSEVFAEAAQVNGSTDESYGPYGYLGYQSYLLTNDYKSVPYQNIISTGGTLRQEKFSESAGGANEVAISLGANYNERLMLGLTLGVTNYTFKRGIDFIERDNTGNTANGFNYFTFREVLNTSGVGVNGKFGLIYGITDKFRIGAAVHTPTFISMTDVADYGIVSDMDGASYDITPNSIYQYDYSLRTPMRAVLSLTNIFGNKGFVTADVEFVPYNTMRYTFKGYQDVADQINTSIKNNFTTGINVRAGGEYRFTEKFTGRLGAAYYGNPYAANVDLGSNRLDLSAGLGYRFSPRFFMDMAYVFSKRQFKEFPYAVTGVAVPKATVDLANNLVALTIGYKF